MRRVVFDRPGRVYVEVRRTHGVLDIAQEGLDVGQVAFLLGQLRRPFKRLAGLFPVEFQGCFVLIQQVPGAFQGPGYAVYQVVQPGHQASGIDFLDVGGAVGNPCGRVGHGKLIAPVAVGRTYVETLVRADPGHIAHLQPGQPGLDCFPRIGPLLNGLAAHPQLVLAVVFQGVLGVNLQNGKPLPVRLNHGFQPPDLPPGVLLLVPVGGAFQAQGIDLVLDLFRPEHHRVAAGQRLGLSRAQHQGVGIVHRPGGDVPLHQGLDRLPLDLHRLPHKFVEAAFLDVLVDLHPAPRVDDLAGLFLDPGAVDLVALADYPTFPLLDVPWSPGNVQVVERRRPVLHVDPYADRLGRTDQDPHIAGADIIEQGFPGVLGLMVLDKGDVLLGNAPPHQLPFQDAVDVADDLRLLCGQALAAFFLRIVVAFLRLVAGLGRSQVQEDQLRSLVGFLGLVNLRDLRRGKLHLAVGVGFGFGPDHPNVQGRFAGVAGYEQHIVLFRLLSGQFVNPIPQMLHVGFQEGVVGGLDAGPLRVSLGVYEAGAHGDHLRDFGRHPHIGHVLKQLGEFGEIHELGKPLGVPVLALGGLLHPHCDLAVGLGPGVEVVETAPPQLRQLEIAHHGPGFGNGVGYGRPGGEHHSVVGKVARPGGEHDTAALGIRPGPVLRQPLDMLGLQEHIPGPL